MAGPVAFERRVFPVGAPMDLVAGASTPTDLTFTVASVDPSVPTSGPGYVIFDFGLPTEDATRWSSRSGNTFTVPDVQSRGCAGTTASGHTPGTGNVIFGFVATDFDEANYWASQLTQVQAPGDQIVGTGPNAVHVVNVGTNGQRWAVSGGLPAWVAPELPAPAVDGYVLTQVAGLPAWQARFNPLLATNQSPPSTSGTPISSATTTPAAISTTYATVTFTAPASGKVKLTFTGYEISGSDGNHHQVWWQNRTGGATIGGVWRDNNNDGSPGEISYKHPVVMQVVSGLTVGASYTLDVWHSMTSGASGVGVLDCYVEAVAA